MLTYYANCGFTKIIVVTYMFSCLADTDNSILPVHRTITDHTFLFVVCWLYCRYLVQFSCRLMGEMIFKRPRRSCAFQNAMCAFWDSPHLYSRLCGTCRARCTNIFIKMVDRLCKKGQYTDSISLGTKSDTHG